MWEGISASSHSRARTKGMIQSIQNNEIMEMIVVILHNPPKFDLHDGDERERKRVDVEGKLLHNGQQDHGGRTRPKDTTEQYREGFFETQP